MNLYEILEISNIYSRVTPLYVSIKNFNLSSYYLLCKENEPYQ